MVADHRLWPGLVATRPDRDLRNVHVLYSVGTDAELKLVWERLAAQAHPAISHSPRPTAAHVIERLNTLNAPQRGQDRE
jgi:hypothetical protein